MSKAMTRAQRAARAVSDGPSILQFIASDEVRPLLVKSATDQQPPVTAISKLLLEKFDGTKIKLLPVRSFVGLCVKAVLEIEGFEVAETGIRVPNDPLFRTGAVYRLAGKKATEGQMSAESDILRAVAQTVTEQQAQSIIAMLQTRFPRLARRLPRL